MTGYCDWWCTCCTWFVLHIIPSMIIYLLWGGSGNNNPIGKQYLPKGNANVVLKLDVDFSKQKLQVHIWLYFECTSRSQSGNEIQTTVAIWYSSVTMGNATTMTKKKLSVQAPRMLLLNILLVLHLHWNQGLHFYRGSKRIILLDIDHPYIYQIKSSHSSDWFFLGRRWITTFLVVCRYVPNQSSRV